MNIKEPMLVLDCHNVQPCAPTRAHVRAWLEFAGTERMEGILLLLLLLLEGRGLLPARFRGPVLQDLTPF